MAEQEMTEDGEESPVPMPILNIPMNLTAVPI